MVSLRELISRNKVDKAVKTFSIGDEFLTHVFQAHLLVQCFKHFKVSTVKASIPHQFNRRWLEDTSKNIIEQALLPLENPTYQQSFMYTSFLYLDLRQSIRFEEGEHIIRMWRLWLPYFLGTDRKNYSCEAANLMCNLKASFPKHIAYLVMHNRTVNMDGRPGHGKPLDLMQEHYNL